MRERWREGSRTERGEGPGEPRRRERKGTPGAMAEVKSGDPRRAVSGPAWGKDGTPGIEEPPRGGEGWVSRHGGVAGRAIREGGGRPAEARRLFRGEV